MQPSRAPHFPCRVTQAAVASSATCSVLCPLRPRRLCAAIVPHCSALARHGPSATLVEALQTTSCPSTVSDNIYASGPRSEDHRERERESVTHDQASKVEVHKKAHTRAHFLPRTSQRQKNNTISSEASHRARLCTCFFSSFLPSFFVTDDDDDDGSKRVWKNHDDDGSVRMPKGRRGPAPVRNRKPASANEGDVAEAHEEEPSFTSTSNGPLLTLLFRSARAQHDALARVESYYESEASSSGGGDKKRYLTLEEARQAKLCRNYEAFNLPVDVVRTWLAEMRTVERQQQLTSDIDADDGQWWRHFCNPAESALLSHLASLGCLQDDGEEEKKEGGGGGGGGGGGEGQRQAPTYLISALASQATASLAHESLHALYFLHPTYRNEVGRLYDEEIPRKMQSIIEHDLSMRGYDRRVWLDEFQAYVSNDAGEFGAKPKEACAEVRSRLRQIQRLCWPEAGLEQQQ